LRVTQIAGALPGFDAGFDVVHDRHTCAWRGCTEIAGRVPEAVTDQDSIALWFFLIGALSNVCDGKDLLAVGGEIYDWAHASCAESVFNRLHGAQADRQKGLNRLPGNRLSLRAAIGADNRIVCLR
jgi:hypothetical protein